ncbi:MAG: hypothetical protein NUW37_10345 [Planctomycetes bacterium]|nr:hypothetical protein [Planctomycetota bacterium]
MANILVLDNPGYYRYLLNSLLKAGGHYVHVTQSESEAANLTLTGIFGVLVVNLESPREPVIEVLAKRREVIPNLPTIGINAGAFREAYQEFEFFSLFQQPIRLGKIADSVRKAVLTLGDSKSGKSVFKVDATNEAEIFTSSKKSYVCNLSSIAAGGLTLLPKQRAANKGVYKHLASLDPEKEYEIKVSAGTVEQPRTDEFKVKIACILSAMTELPQIGLSLVREEGVPAPQVFSDYLPDRFPQPAAAPIATDLQAA